MYVVVKVKILDSLSSILRSLSNIGSDVMHVYGYRLSKNTRDIQDYV